MVTEALAMVYLKISLVPLHLGRPCRDVIAGQTQPSVARLLQQNSSNM